MSTNKSTRFYTTKKAASVLGMKQLEVTRRINRGQIPARKFGWAWMIKEDDVFEVMKSDWYVRYYAKPSEPIAV